MAAGGGGGDKVDSPADGSDLLESAGGGGGGSNLVPNGGTETMDDSDDPSVVISYKADFRGTPPPTAEPEDKQACKKGGFGEFGFENQGSCIKAVIHAG